MPSGRRDSTSDGAEVKLAWVAPLPRPFDDSRRAHTREPSRALATSPWLAAAIGLLALAASGVLLFKDLGLEGIAVDEATMTVVEVEMIRDGHWLFPTFRGSPEARKPPLSMWLAAATLRVAGESEFWLRFWDAAFALGTVALVLWLATRLAGPAAGFTGALLMVTVPEFLFDHCARTNVPDSPLVFFIAASLIAYVYGPATNRGAVLAGLLAGGALLSKGVAAVSLFAAVASYEALTTRGRGLLSARLWIFGVTAIGLAALWFLPAWWVMRDAVSDEIAKDLGGRIFGLRLFRRWPAYLLELRGDFGLWLLFLPPALAAVAARRERSAWLTPTWAVIVLLLFTMASSKYPWYVLPAYPAIAVLIGVGLGAVTNRLRPLRAPAGQVLLVALVAVAVSPAWLRAWKRTGEVRWEHSNLRAFERFASENLPKEVPVFLYREALNHSFAGHETFYAFKLRERLRVAATPKELCAALDASPRGAFAIVPEADLGEVPCLADYRSSLLLRRLSHASRNYTRKRIVPYRITPPHFFAPAETEVVTADGVGLLTGWEKTVAPEGRRRIVARRATVAMDLHDAGRSIVCVRGTWSPATGDCAPALEANGRRLPLVPAPPESCSAAGPETLRAGTNLFAVVRSCAETEIALERISVRRPADPETGPADAGGLLRRLRPGPRLVGALVRDPQAREGLAVVGGGGADRRAGYVFFSPTRLGPGRYTASFDLRALGVAKREPAARADVFAEDRHRTFARRELAAAEIASLDGYVTVPLVFTLDAEEVVQPRVEVTGAAEVRFAGVTIASERGQRRLGARTAER